MSHYWLSTSWNIFNSHTQTHIRFAEFSRCVLHMLVDVIVSGWRLNSSAHECGLCLRTESSECPWTSQAESSLIWSLLWASHVWMWFSGNAHRRKSLGKQERACQSVIQPGKMSSSYSSERTPRKMEWSWALKFSGLTANCKTNGNTITLSF